jgi:hypothetical protein
MRRRTLMKFMAVGPAIVSTPALAQAEGESPMGSDILAQRTRTLTLFTGADTIQLEHGE